jgi:CubicO group peptidase (beta-lactamase class C family)
MEVDLDVKRIGQHAFILVAVVCIAACSAGGTPSETATGSAPPLTAALPTPTVQPSPEEGPATAAPSAPTSTGSEPVAVAPPATLPDYWPTEGWRTSTPEEQGVDGELLGHLFSTIDEQRLNVHSVLVIRNGTIIAERYYGSYDQDTPHQVYSVTKSFISALVGIAIEQGFIGGVDDPVLGFFPEREFANVDDRKEAMTLEDLLTMTAGLDWAEGMPIYQEMARSTDWLGFMLDRPMVAEPGREFNYCSGCSYLLSAIIEETTDVGTQAFAERVLFGPLGIINVDWETDGSGIPNGGWGLNLTPRDMAKLGLLYLNEGFWDGQQVVPAEWVMASVSDRVAVGFGWYYGYQWWLYPYGDRFAAIGLASQLIYVLPDLNAVVVFTAAIGDNDVLFELVSDYVVAAADR